MTEVYNWQKKPESKPSITGKGKEPKYQYTIDKDGKKVLEQVGETDTYAMIQSHLEETKIENIIRRASYDPTALGSMDWAQQARMTDLTTVPDNYHEWRKMLVKTEQEFQKLPAEIKEKFENDTGTYIAEYGTESWAEKVGLTKKTEVKEEKVSEQKQ